jgi:hypothetical protein
MNGFTRTWAWPYFFAGCLTVAIFTLAACTSMLKEPPGITYAESVKQLGIYPVYPPREDLQVGDIYGVEVNQKLAPARLRTVFVDSVDLTKQIKDYLARRYTFADTAAAGSNTNIHGISNELPSQSDKLSAQPELFDRGSLKTLPITAFPTIEVDSGIDVNFAAGSSTIGAFFGFGAAKTIKMTLSYGRVTSYSVPIPVALDALQSYCKWPETAAAPQNCKSEYLAFYMNEKYQLGTEGKDSVRNAVPLMVSKVYLARAISYTFNDRTLAAAAAAVTNTDTSTSAVAPTVNGNLLASAVSNSDSEMVTALAAFQTALNQSVTPKANEEGATISISGFTKNSVTFQEIFQRPVVIGYEGAYLPEIK